MSCDCSLLELCAKKESEAASGLSAQVWLVGAGLKLYICYLSDVLACIGQLSLDKTSNKQPPSVNS